MRIMHCMHIVFDLQRIIASLVIVKVLRLYWLLCCPSWPLLLHHREQGSLNQVKMLCRPHKIRWPRSLISESTWNKPSSVSVNMWWDFWSFYNTIRHQCKGASLTLDFGLVQGNAATSIRDHMLLHSAVKNGQSRVHNHCESIIQAMSMCGCDELWDHSKLPDSFTAGCRATPRTCTVPPFLEAA